MSDIITSDDILGKEAVDPEGSILGIVVKLHVSAESKKIVGITIDQGFMKPDLYVGLEFIRFFGVDAVLLSKVPVTRFKGMHVITVGGNEIGIVKDIILEDEKLKGLLVTENGKPPFSVPLEDVKEIGARVILKDDYRAIKTS